MKSLTILGVFCVVVLAACSGHRDDQAQDSPVKDSVIGYFNPGDLKESTNPIADTSGIIRRILDRQFDAYKSSIPIFNTGDRQWYIVQGDEKMSEDELHDFWLAFIYKDRKQLHMDTSAFVFQQPQVIIGTNTDGVPLVYPPGTTLRFSICKASFPNIQLYNQTKSYFLQACRDWEGLVNIKLQYVPERDLDTERLLPPAGLTFAVVYTESLPRTNTSDVLALAYYKNESDAKVYLFPRLFDNIAVSKPGILKHEIGHILGFRHEHISSAAPSDCPKGERIGTIIAKTRYDHNSIMHNICGEFNNTNMVFTEKDTAGFRAAYCKPGIKDCNPLIFK